MTYDEFDWMEEALAQIESIYPRCSTEVQRELADRFRHLQDVSDGWLDAWLLLQERFRDVIEKYPELAGQNDTSTAFFPPAVQPDNKEVGEAGPDLQSDESLKFWVDERAMQQFRIGQGYYNLWMFSDAMSQFLQVVDDEPDFVLARLYLALTYFQQEQWERAETEFQLVLETAPHPEFLRFCHHMLGCLFVRQKKDVKAVRHFSRALEMDVENSDTLFNLGACHYRLGSVQFAIPCFEQAIALNGDDWESMVYLAHCYTALGDHDQGTHWRKQAYEMSRKPWIISEIADSYERQQQLDEALKWNLYCVTNHPEWAEGYHGVAWNIWKKDRHPLAVVWLKKALTLKRDDVNILFSYWWIIHHVGTPEEKARVNRHVSSMMHQSPLWSLAHGNVYRVSGDFEQARKTLTPLLTAEEVRVQGAAHYQLAHLCMAEQKWKEAVDHFHKARECDGLLHETLLFEGICHYLTGDREASKNCLRLYQQQQSNDGR